MHHFSETENFSLDIHYKESLNSKVVPVSRCSSVEYNSGQNFVIGLISALVSQL